MTEAKRLRKLRIKAANAAAARGANIKEARIAGKRAADEARFGGEDDA